MIATPKSYPLLVTVMTPLISMPSSVRVPVLSKHTSLILPQRLTLSEGGGGGGGKCGTPYIPLI